MALSVTRMAKAAPLVVAAQLLLGCLSHVVCPPPAPVDVPVDQAFELPNVLSVDGERWSMQLTSLAANVKGQLHSRSEIGSTCHVERMATGFAGEVSARAEVRITLQDGLSLGRVEPSTGWHQFTVSAGVVPVIVFVRAGVALELKAELEGQMDIDLIAETQMVGNSSLSYDKTRWNVTLPEELGTTLTASVTTPGKFGVRLDAEPWIEVRMYAVVGPRLTLFGDVTLTGDADGKCDASWSIDRVEGQAVVGNIMFGKPLYESPAVKVPLGDVSLQGDIQLGCGAPEGE